MSIFNKISSTISNAANAKFDRVVRSATDKEYNEQRVHFVRHRKNLIRLRRSVKEFQDAAEALARAQIAITKNLGKVIGDKECKVDPLWVAEDRFTAQVQAHTKAMATGGVGDCLASLDNYLGEFTELQKRMDEWKRREDGFIEAERSLKAVEQKNLRTADYKANCDDLKVSLDELGKEIKRDVAVLRADKTPFCQVFIPVLANTQMKFFNDAGTSLLAQSAQACDPLRAKSHPFVITPGGSSVAFGHRGGPTPANPAYGNSAPTPPAYGQPPPVPQKGGHGATAQGLYDFNASEPKELSFRAGDTLTILDQTGSWWRAQHPNGHQGVVPSNYVKLL